MILPKQKTPASLAGMKIISASPGGEWNDKSEWGKSSTLLKSEED